MAKSIVPTSKRPQKSLTKILKKHSGRDSTGHVSVRHQGGRHKRFYRIIDFKRDKRDMSATVLGIEYDPNRNAHIALVQYQDGERRYIIQPVNLKAGDTIIASEKAEITTGNAVPLEAIPVGIEVHNIELYAGQGGILVRSAGSFASVVAKDGLYVHLKLASGEIRKFHNECWATIGRIGNIEFKDKIIGSAGRKRHMGIRPTVRGTAQHPNSHPHGGGEGRSGEGMHPKTPWGKSARGTRTRSKKKWSKSLIIKRRK
ncbi:MAG: 50S ribosomal protein L2 [bacterium]|nr:50S ribosomal protein L2 [bacterium]